MFVKMFTCVTIEQYGGSVHPAATGKDAPARNVGAIEGSSPLLLFLLFLAPSSHSFALSLSLYSPLLLYLALASHSFRPCGCSHDRPRSNMRRAVAPVGCNRGMRPCGNYKRGPSRNLGWDGGALAA